MGLGEGSLAVKVMRTSSFAHLGLPTMVCLTPGPKAMEPADLFQCDPKPMSTSGCVCHTFCHRDTCLTRTLPKEEQSHGSSLEQCFGLTTTIVIYIGLSGSGGEETVLHHRLDHLDMGNLVLGTESTVHEPRRRALGEHRCPLHLLNLKNVPLTRSPSGFYTE